MTEEQERQGMDLSEFAGPGCAAAENRMTEELDMSVADAQNEQDKEIEAKARTIYESGESLQYFEDCCQRKHIGDKILLRTLILSAAHTKILNSPIELNLNIGGAAGSGKSHAATTVLNLIPDSKKMFGRFSDKAILYAAETMQPGTLICFDDQSLSEVAAEIMKAQTSDAQQPFIYRVVSEQKLTELVIPPRVTRWFIKADSAGAADEQTRDRELRLFADSSTTHQQEIKRHIDDVAANPKQFFCSDMEAVCRKIWDNIPEASVSIPFTHRINPGRKGQTRNYHLFLGMIRSAALLSAPKRKTDDGFIVASEEDFRTASGIMNQILEGERGNQKHGLTRTQSRILSYLRTLPTGDYSFKELREDEKLRIPSSTFEDAVKGRGDSDGGMRRLPGIDIVRHEGRRLFIEWNREQFEAWDESDAYFVLEEEQ